MAASSPPPPTHRASIQRFARDVYTDAILDAAERLFLKIGYAETKMAEVASSAGVAVGTLYKHFSGKEALLASLAVRHRELVFQEIDQCEQIDDPVLRLRAIVDRGLAAAEGGRAMFAVYLQLRAVVESQIKARGGVDEEETAARFQQAIAQAHADGVERGKFRHGVSPERFGAALCAALNAEMIAWVQAGRGDSLVARGRALVDLLLEGAEVR